MHLLVKCIAPDGKTYITPGGEIYYSWWWRFNCNLRRKFHCTWCKTWLHLYLQLTSISPYEHIRDCNGVRGHATAGPTQATAPEKQLTCFYPYIQLVHSCNHVQLHLKSLSRPNTVIIARELHLKYSVLGTTASEVQCTRHNCIWSTMY